uniref:Uncharacterized protein n=1 Tax=Rhizophora mucronata TaxID=61149 RepID=A0A2P2PBJ8_RHIMU
MDDFKVNAKINILNAFYVHGSSLHGEVEICDVTYPSQGIGCRNFS